MRFTRVVRTPSVLMVLGLALALACAADDVIININPEGDSIQFSVPWDSIDEVTDTIIVDGDTIVLIVVDTIIGPIDTVLVPIVDTVIQSDTVVNTVVDTLTLTDTVFQNVVDTVVDGGDTTFVVVTDTVVEVNDVITVTYDTTLVTDTIVETVYDTVIQFDTVIEIRTDTVIEVDTVLLVDTVITSPPSLDFSVGTLVLEVGESATLQVTMTNALGFPVPSTDIAWLSSNPTVAGVAEGGVVTGVSDGSTQVFAIADADGLAATLSVDVYDPQIVTPPSTGGGHPDRDPGENLPDGLEPVFLFDVTQPDQGNLNPDIANQFFGLAWETPQTSPERGVFFDQNDGGVAYTRWAWAAGDRTRAAGSEIRLSRPYTEWYVRITWRANPNWEFSGGTVKQMFFQKTPWVEGETANLAVGVQRSGRIASINSSPELQGPTLADMGEWIDDEWHYRDIPGPSLVTGWRNGIQEFEATVSQGNVAPNMLSLGPYHGGSGTKSQADWWDIRRLVIWARECP